MEIIIGSAASVVTQLIKKYAQTAPWVTWATAIVLSVVGAYIYVTMRGTPLWETIVSVLTTSGAFYAYIIARFEK